MVSVGEAVPELRSLLREATASLATLDFEALEGMEARAVQLRGMFAGQALAGGDGVAEILAQHRVFGEVLRATADHLAVVGRVCGRRGYGGRQHSLGG